MERLVRTGAFTLCDVGSLEEFCTLEGHILICILTIPTRPTLGHSVRAFFQRLICSELKFLESKKCILHISFLPEP